MSERWYEGHEYYSLSAAEQDMADALWDMVYEAQYPRPGGKAAARRDTSIALVKAIREGYFIHQVTKRKLPAYFYEEKNNV